MTEKTLTKPAETDVSRVSDNGAQRVVQDVGTKDGLAVLKAADKVKTDASLPQLDLVDPQAANKITVEVKKGDTLSGIVNKNLQLQDGESSSHYRTRLYNEVAKVAKENGITHPDRILDGQKIQINKQGEAKPTEVKPTEVKPTEVKPTEVKPTEVKPTEVKPTEVKPTEVKPTEVKPTEVKPTEVKPTEVKPTEVKPTEVKPTDQTTPGDKIEPRLELPKPADQTAQLTAKEFSEAGTNVLKKIHPDGSPATKGDLAAALQDSTISGKEAQALAAMYANFDGLSKLNGSDGLFSRNSISAEDLAKYPDASKTQADKVADAYATKYWMDNNFNKYAGTDGTLKEGQIDKALADPKTPPEDKTQLEKLKKVMPDIGHGWPFGEKGMTKEDFNKEVTRIHTESPEAKLVNGVEFSLSGAYESQRTTRGATLYRSENPLDSIKPDAIKQGAIGDCYFEASLAAVASSRPEIIRDSIRDNKDGTYTVTFPGAKDEPITVKAPTEAEMALYNRGAANGTWAAVMEKAYGKYRDNHAWIGSYTPQDAADGGGDPGSALELLTGGKNTTLKPEDMSQKDLADQLERAFTGPHHKSVTASSSAEWKGFFGGGWSTEGNTTDGFVRSHAFTITGFKPDGKGGGMVQMRNPWGGQDGVGGKFEIPLEKLPKNFWRLSITETD